MSVINFIRPSLSEVHGAEAQRVIPLQSTCIRTHSYTCIRTQRNKPRKWFGNRTMSKCQDLLMPAVKILLEVQQLNCWEAIIIKGEENTTTFGAEDIKLKNH